ncbi:hypothetical protein ISG33_15780 [Glaciecola sp. MH2013]|uniref:hypothetical protein n=1 Tax=Glaciecola sp. MH2013 TaxID=2785524 RepID=UPI0018A09174|nr:hypothetical protein [Glaciecola sp. MH2013]MBF7074862.1 hypothetical protein [Glaciecola sp. MH2013]
MKNNLLASINNNKSFGRRVGLGLSLAILWTTPISTAFAKVKLIANVDEEISLSRQEVKSLFLGGAVQYELSAVALEPDHRTRLQFNTHVLGLTESRIQSYWAQMRFSGKSKPPRELASEQSAIAYVMNNKGAVTYVDEATELPDSLKVVFETK